MQQIKQAAIHSFRSGQNCAQSVLTAYAAELNFDYDLALKISSGFGAGMARMQETCGAVTGSFMVLGLHNGRRYPVNDTCKKKTFEMIQEFSRQFSCKHGSTNCKNLLGCDLTTEEGQTFFKQNHLIETVCEKCICDSISIIENLIRK